MLHLPDVEVFLEIVNAGSFTGAARALKAPKSSVARQLARLEAALGTPLLDRSTRSVTLTAQGRTFVPHARRLLDDAVEAETALRADGKGPSGLLTIATTGLVGRRFIVPGLPQFRARHPQVRVALWLGAQQHALGSGPGEADIAIRLRTVASPEVGNRKLGEIAFAMVASPGYLARAGMPEEPEDLAAHALLELGPAGKHNRLVLNGPERTATVTYAPPIQIDDPEAVRLAALAGCGIAVLPRFLVAEDVRAGRLALLLDAWRQAPIPIHVLFRTHVAPPPRVRAYVDFLFETLGTTQPWAVDL